MYLEEFFDYKNQLIGDLLTNDKIVKLLDDVEEFSEPEELMYTHVFPYEYIPEVINQGWSYICCDVDIRRGAGSKTFWYPTLYIWTFSHKSRLRLPEGGVRPDRICAEICKKVNGSKYYGLGELELDSVSRFVPLDDHQGRVMVFKAKDFSRVYDGKRPIPANRKQG